MIGSTPPLSRPHSESPGGRRAPRYEYYYANDSRWLYKVAQTIDSVTRNSINFLGRYHTTLCVSLRTLDLSKFSSFAQWHTGLMEFKPAVRTTCFAYCFSHVLTTFHDLRTNFIKSHASITEWLKFPVRFKKNSVKFEVGNGIDCHYRCTIGEKVDVEII